MSTQVSNNPIYWNNRQRAIKAADATKEKIKTQILVQTGTKTWVYVNPGEKPKEKSEMKMPTRNELRGGHNRKEVSANGVILPSLRRAAEYLSISRSMAERLIYGRSKNPNIVIFYTVNE